MNKKILLAVDNTRPSRSAMQYAVEMSSVVTDLHYVLFHAQPPVSFFLQEEAKKGGMAKKQLEKVHKRNEQFASQLLADLRNEMESKGVAGDRIQTATKTRNLGYAKDIINYAQQGQFDAIVLGRRGLSGLMRMYAGSVTTDILEQSQVIPVWLVDGEAAGSEILVAVDGSEASLRVVDHVSFFLSGSPNSRLTLLHVTSNARNYCEVDLDEHPNPDLEKIIVRGDKACVDQFYDHAMQKFRQTGIDKDRIRVETVQGRRQVGKLIIEFAQQGKYRTLVVGRRGIDKSFFMGSVSRTMIDKLSDGALWLVP